MARRASKANTPAVDVAAIKEFLDGFLETVDAGTLREKVKSLVPAVHKLRDLGSSLVPKETASSARDRIEHYFSAYPRTVIDGDELLVISGIGEWARRVRELRVQFGWWIYSGVTINEIAEEEPELIAELREMLAVDPVSVRPDQYVLIRPERDRDAAYRWNLINSIRKKGVSVKDKLLEYLRANAGKIVSGEELRYLANDRNEWPRRTRELRTEDGWPVFTKMQGRKDLPVGAYLLEEDRQAEVHDRKISDAVRVEVLQRDGFKCVACGWDRSQLMDGDPRKFLELHHVQAHAGGGTNKADNLVCLCNVDHDEVHAKRLDFRGGAWVKIAKS